MFFFVDQKQNLKRVFEYFFYFQWNKKCNSKLLAYKCYIMNECIICEGVCWKLVDKPTESSYETLLEGTRERHRQRDQAVASFVERTVDVSPATLIENHATYHRVCYSNYTDKSKIDRAKKQYHEAVETGDTSAIKQKTGRPY